MTVKLDLFGNPICEQESTKSQKKRKSSISGGTEIQKLFKYNVWNGLETTGPYDIPIIKQYEIENAPSKLIPFNIALSSKNFDCAVHFYLNDPLFIRIFRKPKHYLEILKRFKYVISPDLSEYMEMPYWLRFSNSCWNKALAAYWQAHGINIIMNITWSAEDSFAYSFEGIPQGCVVAISSVAIKSHPYSAHRWQIGYAEAIKRLKPKQILRYGEKMPNEKETISVYYDDYIKSNFRNGIKRKF